MQESHSLLAGQLLLHCYAGGALQAQNTPGHIWHSRFQQIQAVTKHEQTLTSRTMFLLLVWKQIIQGVLGGVTFLLLLREQESQRCSFSEKTTAAWADSAATNTLNFLVIPATTFLPPDKTKFPPSYIGTLFHVFAKDPVPGRLPLVTRTAVHCSWEGVTSRTRLLHSGNPAGPTPQQKKAAA